MDSIDLDCRHWWIVVAVFLLLLVRKDTAWLLGWWLGRRPPSDEDVDPRNPPNRE